MNHEVLAKIVNMEQYAQGILKECAGLREMLGEQRNVRGRQHRYEYRGKVYSTNALITTAVSEMARKHNLDDLLRAFPSNVRERPVYPFIISEDEWKEKQQWLRERYSAPVKTQDGHTVRVFGRFSISKPGGFDKVGYIIGILRAKRYEIRKIN